MYKPAHLQSETNKLIIPGFFSTISCCFIISINLFLGFTGTIYQINPRIALMLSPTSADATVALVNQKKPSTEKPDRNSDQSNKNAVELVATRFDFILNKKLALKVLTRSWRSEPFSSEAIALLGVINDLTGQKTEATEFFKMATRLSRRDKNILVWKLLKALENSDAKEIVDRLALVYQLNKSMRRELIAIFSRLSDSSDGRKIIASALKKNPVWRVPFLRNYPRYTTFPNSLVSFFSLISIPEKKVETVIVESFISRLLREGLYESAYFIWLQDLHPSELSRLPLLYNGNFESRQSNNSFNWLLSSTSGADTRILHNRNTNNRYLQIDFGGARVPYRHTSKILLMTPGNYRLSGSRILKYLDGPRGLVWRIVCLSRDGHKLLAESELMRGHYPNWKDFSMDFLIPESACEAQKLYLSTAARNSAESILSGSILFDNLTIVRQ